MAPPNSSPSPPPSPFCLLVCLANSLSWQVYQEAITLLKPGACWTFTSVGRCALGGQLLQLLYCSAQTFKFLGRSYCCPCSKEQTFGALGPVYLVCQSTGNALLQGHLGWPSGLPVQARKEACVLGACHSPHKSSTAVKLPVDF